MTDAFKTGKDYLWRDPHGRLMTMRYVSGLWSSTEGRTFDYASLVELGWKIENPDTAG